MAYRTVEITGPAELHVRSGSLVVEKEIRVPVADRPEDVKTNTAQPPRKRGRPKKQPVPETNKWIVPLEDIRTIICMGAGVRISTMAMAQLCDYKISMMMLDEKYRPAGLLSAYEANTKQSMIMRQQVYASTARLNALWITIIQTKICNQAKALDLLCLEGSQEVLSYNRRLLAAVRAGMSIDPVEAGAARIYFRYLCPELNRREDAPFNSCLNYGYSIVRNSIVREIIAAGLLPSFGIHHQNLFNAYNLADDLIEVFRPCVDMITYRIADDRVQLDREQRRELTGVLLQAVQLGDRKVNILSAIDMMIEDLRSFYAEEKQGICLPQLLPEEKIPVVRE